MIETKELQERVEKLPRIRKTIAKNLKNAMEQVAYCSLVQKVNASSLWNYRKNIVKDVEAKTGTKLTFLAWIIRSAAIALSEFPIFSAKVNEEAGEIHYPGQINIGIAVDTEYGLVVPVIKGVEKLSLIEIQNEVIRLATLARDKKLQMSDMQGGCFTITNIGSVGALFGTPIMNYPEIAILAVGSIIDEAIVQEGQIVPGKSLYMTIAADHRWVDGADMARFNGRVKQLLESPEEL
ncbi:2-oxo acid dehydrogenase subunit E2 [Mycoplasma phocoenae]|uniref:Dihydrolipoamide acetyltransferase n=1 Tax=Mycoplasma phocoenae TaxID=754517 RepID=A0A858U453_9MOLU|nr:2-oxo acid dehydrogenase subunit E2 [Mycoplasma phocoenae]QJG66849.1 dihydrolipoamide acetyltransferase [Mycoplasma phocoenae]